MLVLVKRKNAKVTVRYQRPIIRIEYPRGRFVFSKPLCKMLELKAGDGVMFAFNRTNKKGYLIKDNEEDSFFLREKTKNNLRFDSKDLLSHFIDTFDLLDGGKSTWYFECELEEDKKGMREIRITEKK